jgi:hypothetical protein
VSNLSETPSLSCSLQAVEVKAICYRAAAALSGRSGLDEDGALRGLFSALAAVDFEIAIRALEDAALVE